MVARLVGPLLDPADLSVGYDWCRQQLVQANYPQLGNEVQLAKAWAYLGRKEYQTAIGILKVCMPGWAGLRGQATVCVLPPFDNRGMSSVMRSTERIAANGVGTAGKAVFFCWAVGL